VINLEDKERMMRRLSIKVIPVCIDKHNNSNEIGGKECMDCFNRIYKETGYPCHAYSKGNYFKERTLVVANQIIAELPSNTPIEISSSGEMHG
jgi:hypothetical protein